MLLVALGRVDTVGKAMIVNVRVLAWVLLAIDEVALLKIVGTAAEVEFLVTRTVGAGLVVLFVVVLFPPAVAGRRMLVLRGLEATVDKEEVKFLESVGVDLVEELVASEDGSEVGLTERFPGLVEVPFIDVKFPPGVSTNVVFVVPVVDGAAVVLFVAFCPDGPTEGNALLSRVTRLTTAEGLVLVDDGVDAGEAGLQDWILAVEAEKF